MKSLTWCPQCKYSLKGLPANHNCPECGFEYDAETAAWHHQPSRIWTSFEILATLFFGGSFVNGAIDKTQSAGGLRLFDLLFILGFVFMLWLLIRGFSASLTIATTPGGLYIKKGRRHGTLVPWAQVQRVFWSVASRKCELKIASKVRMKLITRIFEDQADFEDFESEVQERKQTLEGTSLIEPTNEGSRTRRWRSRL